MVFDEEELEALLESVFIHIEFYLHPTGKIERQRDRHIMYKGVQEEKEKSAVGKYREAFILIRQKRGNKWWEVNKSGGRKRCKVDIKG